MWLALGMATGSVALGAALVLFGTRNRTILAPVRTFALVAAVVVVLARLLPSALAEVGLWALAVFAVALVLPAGFERWIDASRRKRAAKGGRDPSWVAVEFGFIGILVHRLGDGMALGLFAGDADGLTPNVGALLALAAHGIPVTAVLVLAYVERYGVRHAVFRALGVAVASVLGVVLIDAAPLRGVAAAEPWILAIASGLLLHVIGHDWHAEVPTNTGGRIADLLAIAAGVAVGFVGGAGHPAGQGSAEAMRTGILDALGEFTLETAPVLLFGLAIGALLQTLGGRISTRWLQSGSSLQQAVRGAVVGAPLPICACGVLPLADALKSKGAGPALVVAFLLATPELGVESFALTVQFLGWPFAAVRLAAAVGVAVVAALLLARQVGASTPSHLVTTPLAPGSSQQASWARFVDHFDELLHHVGPFTVVGLLAAAYLQAAMPAQAVHGLAESGLDILVVSLVAVPSYVCAAAATPLAAVLIGKGFSSGAVLAGLLLGPATNLATVAFLRGAFGARAAWVGLGGLVVMVWIVAALANLFGLSATQAVAEAERAHAHSYWALGASALLGALILRSVWRSGLRTWLSTLGDALGGGHKHAH